ncbi:MAG: hypothetical protein J6X86_05025 [Bacteroidales bacterium]|nr:hypothetical protein [Bacteroidales bacterium]
MKRILTVSCFLLLFMTFSTVSAQMSYPAHWKFNVKTISDKEVELQFQLTLDEGWKIFSQKSDINGPFPAEFTFTPNANYQRVGDVVEPKAHEEDDEIFGCKVLSFSGKVTFRQKIKRNTDKAFEVKGSIYCQLGSDDSFIAPDDIPFSFSVPAVKKDDGASTENIKINTFLDQGYITITMESDVAEVEFFDSDGDSVRRIPKYNNGVRIIVSKMPKDRYTVSVRTKKGKKKFMLNMK